MRTALRRLFFSNVVGTLAVLLGLMQALIAHWLLVVIAGRDGPGLPLGLGIAAVLVIANFVSVPTIRSMRHRPGWPKRFARGYMTGAVITLLLGLAVSAAWIGLFPIASLLGFLGVGPDEAFALFRVASILVVGSLAFMLVWGFTLGQHRVERTHTRVGIDGLHPDHHGLRIVQLSDFHIGNGMEGDRLASLVRDVNAMEADVIALTGDLFDFDPRFIEEGARGLAGLRAKLGVFAVLGNHDTYAGVEEVVRGLSDHAPNVQLLRGNVARLPLSEPLYVAGVDDPGRDWTARGVHLQDLERMGAELPVDGPVVLLVHRPEVFVQASRMEFPLILAGHTHGGQLALPTPGGRYNLARLITPFHRGLFRENGSVLYVNRGIGVAGPAIRFNCSREIATIELAVVSS